MRESRSDVMYGTSSGSPGVSGAEPRRTTDSTRSFSELAVLPVDADRAPASGASDQWWIGQFGAAPSPPRDARARVNLGGHARTILRSVFNRRADKWENSSTEWPTHRRRCPSMGTIRRERSRRVRRRWGAILGCAEQSSSVSCE